MIPKNDKNKSIKQKITVILFLKVASNTSRHNNLSHLLVDYENLVG
jgi:hypothetical protein